MTLTTQGIIFVDSCSQALCAFLLKGLGQVACSDANFQEMDVHRRVAVWVERFKDACNGVWL